jgi:hypothetical protein
LHKWTGKKLWIGLRGFKLDTRRLDRVETTIMDENRSASVFAFEGYCPLKNRREIGGANSTPQGPLNAERRE